MPTTRELLEAQRDRVLAILRTREPDLMRELESLNLAIGNLGEGANAPDHFTGHTHAWKAIVAYLERIKRTEDEDAIAKAVVDGGWLKGNPYALRNAKNSIIYQVRNWRHNKIIKRFPSGRVGLYDWPSDYDRGVIK